MKGTETLKTTLSRCFLQIVRPDQGAQAPLGGVKDSGWGKHSGLACIEEFTELKWITYQKTPRQYHL